MSIAKGIAAARLAMEAGSKALDLLLHPKVDPDAVRKEVTAMYALVESARRALGDAEDENRTLRRQLDQSDAPNASRRYGVPAGYRFLCPKVRARRWECRSLLSGMLG